MTVIVGWHSNKEAWIAGDSGAFGGDDNSVFTTETKVWKAEDSLIGAAGDFRIAEIAYESQIGEPYRLRDHLEQWAKNSMVGENDTEFLVVSTSGIYIIDSCFAVIRCKEPYGAIGGANSAVLTAMCVLQGVAMNGKQKLTAILKAVSAHTNVTKPPFKIISL
jgi:ATP-dependent protease HslVU (ClpYQ) peptidase subunit